MADDININVEQSEADAETAPAGPGVGPELETSHAVAVSAEEAQETAEVATLVAKEAAEAALRSTEEVKRLREEARDERWQDLQNKLDQIITLLTEPEPAPETAPEAEYLKITPEAESSPSNDGGSGPRRKRKTLKRRLWK